MESETQKKLAQNALRNILSSLSYGMSGGYESAGNLIEAIDNLIKARIEEAKNDH